MAAARKQNYRNSLRPALLANGIIAAVILAGIGVTYAWLAWQKRVRHDQNTAARNAISQLHRQRQALQVRMKARLDGTELRQRAEGMELGLVDIPPDRLVTVPDEAPPDPHR